MDTRAECWYEKKSAFNMMIMEGRTTCLCIKGSHASANVRPLRMNLRLSFHQNQESWKKKNIGSNKSRIQWHVNDGAKWWSEGRRWRKEGMSKNATKARNLKHVTRALESVERGKRGKKEKEKRWEDKRQEKRVRRMTGRRPERSCGEMRTDPIFPAPSLLSPLFPSSTLI